MRTLLTTLTAGLLGISAIAAAADQQSAATKAAYAEMRQMFGTVPSFLNAFPERGIVGAWEELKSVQLAPDTAIPPKYKELIGLAVASQIPCQYCVYFHVAGARADGATDEEIREAIAMSALTRHWSTVLNGSQIDFDAFRAEADAMMKYAQEHAEKAPPKGANKK